MYLGKVQMEQSLSKINHIKKWYEADTSLVQQQTRLFEYLSSLAPIYKAPGKICLGTLYHINQTKPSETV